MNTPPSAPRSTQHRLNYLTRALVLGGIGWLGAHTSALAADRTWNGSAGDALWNTGGNWNTKPNLSGDSLLFGNAGAGILENDFTGASFGRIEFLSDAGAYTLQGNAITIGAVGITNKSAITQTIDLNLTLATAVSHYFHPTNGDLVINGSISGAGQVAVTTKGSVVSLNAANTHTGGVTVNGGKLHLGNANALGTGIFTITGVDASTPTVTFAAGIGTFYAGGVSGSGGPVALEDVNGEGVTLYLRTGNGDTSRSNAFTGKGGLTIDAGSSGKQVLSGTNTYTGGTLIKSGTLELFGAGGTITGALTMEGGELSIQRGNASKTVTLSALNGTGGKITGNTGTGTATLTLNTTSINRFEGDLTNGNSALAFNKQGAGSFTFAGAGTYTGATSVDAGIYDLEGSLTSSLVTVKSGATLQGSGGHIGQSLTLNSGSSLLFELAAGLTEPLLTVGSLSLGSTVDLKLVLGEVIMAGTEIQLIDLGSGANRSFATINGAALSPDGLFTLTYGAEDYLFQYQESASAISLIAIPEPQSTAMLLLGAGALAGAFWTRRRSDARVIQQS